MAGTHAPLYPPSSPRDRADAMAGAWRGVLVCDAARLRPRRALSVLAGAVRYAETALVPAAAGVWLYVLGVTARAL